MKTTINVRVGNRRGGEDPRGMGRRLMRSMALCMLTAVGWNVAVLAQPDTVDVPDSFVAPGGLNAAIDAKAGNLSETVFRLAPYGLYVLVKPIVIPAGERLTIIAPEAGHTQATAPPQIRMADTTESPDALAFFYCRGELSLRNVWLFYGDGLGRQKSTRVKFEDSPDSVRGQVGYFEGVVFDYSWVPIDASGAVDVVCRHFRGTFRNCYFKNCADPHMRYYGRAVSFPYGSTGWHIDSLAFENCTFANIGYVYMQEGGEYADYVRFNHCTFMNVMMYPLESGWWHRLAVTNSIFFNVWMVGDFGLGESEGGTIVIDSIANFGFDVPFSEQDRRILFAHNSYFLEQWLRDWMVNNPASIEWMNTGHPEYVPKPMPMLGVKTLRFFDSTENGQKLFPYMNRAHLLDSTDPGFVHPPTDIPAIARFVYFRWWCSCDTPWAYKPQQSVDRLWPLEESLSYTNTELFSGATGGFPLGDLYHWFPERYVLWEAQQSGEAEKITTWMETGVDPGGSLRVPEHSGSVHPVAIDLRQNYPNPFNASTTILYTVGATGMVRIAVYNVLGQEVATLTDEVRQPGTYSVSWNASEFPSGAYYCRMRAGGFVQTKVMTLLK